MERILKPGDLCNDCHLLGRTRYLRYFHINLEDEILKCESDECLYPYEDDCEDACQASDVQDAIKQISPTRIAPDSFSETTRLYAVDNFSNDSSTLKLENNHCNADSFDAELNTSTFLNHSEISLLQVQTKQNEKRSEKISLAKIEYIGKRPTSSTEVSQSNSSKISEHNSHEIPKARIKRFLSAINSYKKLSIAKLNQKSSPRAQQSPLQKNSILIKKVSKSSHNEKTSRIRHLDLMQDIVNKTNS